jgi:hypothetical protein
LLAGGIKTLSYYLSRRTQTFWSEVTIVVELLFIKAPAELHVPMLEWLFHSSYKPWDNVQWKSSSRLSMLAAAICSLEVVQWLVGKGTALSASVWMAAIQYRRVETMKWMFAATDSRPDERTFMLAAYNQDAPTLKWLVEVVRCPIEYESIVTCDDAAKKGNMEVLDLLHSYGCPWDSSTFCIAMSGGATLEQLQWMANAGCPATNEIGVNIAVSRGDKEIVTWLLNLTPRPCELREVACETAIEHDQFDMVPWLVSLGCPVSVPRCIVAAARANHVVALDWLVVHDPDLAATIPPCAATASAAAGHVEALRWILAHVPADYVCEPPAFILAARHGHLGTLKVLHETGHEWDNTKCAEEAIVNQHVELYDWIRSVAGNVEEL